jgi:hypothetical protein
LRQACKYQSSALIGGIHCQAASADMEYLPPDCIRSHEISSARLHPPTVNICHQAASADMEYLPPGDICRQFSFKEDT